MMNKMNLIDEDRFAAVSTLSGLALLVVLAYLRWTTIPLEILALECTIALIFFGPLICLWSRLIVIHSMLLEAARERAEIRDRLGRI